MGRIPRGIKPLDVLALTTGLWFLAKLLRYAFPPLFEPFQAFYGVSNTELGIAFGGLMLCYAAMQFPSGVLRDRFGPVSVMVVGGTIAALAALSLAVEAGFALLVGVMLIIGIGTGLHKTVSVTLLAAVYPSRTGRVLGIHDTFGALAGFVAPLGVIYFLGWIGWRAFFVLAGLCGVVLATAALARIPRQSPSRTGAPPAKGETEPLRAYVGLFGDPRIVLFVIATVAFSFAYYGAVAFLPLYLIEEGGLDVRSAGILYSVLFAVTFVQLATGELSDRIGRLSIILGCLGLALVGLGGLLVVSTPILLGVAVVGLGLGAHGYRPPRDAYLAELIPDRVAGGGIGLIRSLLMGAGALAPAVVGASADIFGFRPAFAILGVSLAIATVAVLVLLTPLSD